MLIPATYSMNELGHLGKGYHLTNNKHEITERFYCCVSFGEGEGKSLSPVTLLIGTGLLPDNP